MEQEFEITEEIVLQDLSEIREDKQIKPKSRGVRVKIEKPSVGIAYKDNRKDVAKGGPDNPPAYKYINCSFRILDGLTVEKEDGTQEIKYKNAVLFPQRMDLVFWHNPSVKNSDWWMNLKYVHGFKQLCQALNLDLKSIKINDDFLESINGKELLLDIDHEEESELVDGEWKPKGTFREKVRNFQRWE